MSGERADDPDFRPARGYSWAPFQPGHELSMSHGAYSERRVGPLAQEILDGLLALATTAESSVPWLAEPSYRPALAAWSRAEARVQLLEAWLAEHGGDVDEEGEVRGAAAFLARCEARAESLRSKLGLDPLSRARLGRDVAVAGRVDLAQVLARLDEDDEERQG